MSEMNIDKLTKQSTCRTPCPTCVPTAELTDSPSRDCRPQSQRIRATSICAVCVPAYTHTDKIRQLFMGIKKGWLRQLCRAAAAAAVCTRR